jgi:shikimate dehydrogenase
MRLYGLIGLSLVHSFSQKYFTRKFETEGLADCAYLNFELNSIEEFPSLLINYPELCGVNITIPYKEKILSYLDAATDMVRTIGACNCIKIENKKTIGHNTDATAFKNSIFPNLKAWHNRALVLGSGGASKAVCYALSELKINFRIVSRYPLNDELSYNDLNETILKDHKIIVNTTPLGTFPGVNELPSIPYHLLDSSHLLYDLIYNPDKTRFLQEGEKRGAAILNGGEMLKLQAEESWRIWNS